MRGEVEGNHPGVQHSESLDGALSLENKSNALVPAADITIQIIYDIIKSLSRNVFEYLFFF